MTRHFGDWKIEVSQIDLWSFGRGFRAIACVPKTDGTKSDIREFYRYGDIKTYKQMFEYVQKMLEV